ncbi:MAG: GYDIA family GHMP kinase [Saprospiraceae bacterium]
MQQQFSANGKLLLTGEYFVLDGAEAIALPTFLGQRLTVEETIDTKNSLHWNSINHDGITWFSAIYNTDTFDIIFSDNDELALRLQQILLATRQQNIDFLIGKSYTATTKLDFPNNWGLGSSSTLISLLAQWANVDAFKLLQATFGGSGYDIACAEASTPILYQVIDNKPIWKNVHFSPSFVNKLFFVFLNQKQNSRAEIARYLQVKAEKKWNESILKYFKKINHVLLTTNTLTEFEFALNEHENIISTALSFPKVKDLFFSDYVGSIKSLGAWGGDFVLATAPESVEQSMQYFTEKGYTTIIPYTQLIR